MITKVYKEKQHIKYTNERKKMDNELKVLKKESINSTNLISKAVIDIKEKGIINLNNLPFGFSNFLEKKILNEMKEEQEDINLFIIGFDEKEVKKNE